MKLAPLTLTGQGYTLSVSPDATAKKAALLEASLTVTAVTDESLELARVTLKGLAEFRSALEKSRKAIKAPILEAGRDIDGKAAEFGAEPEQEEKRIEALIKTYAAEQETKRRAAELEAQRKAAEAQKAAEEAERLRQASAEKEKPKSFAEAAAALSAQEEADARAQASQEAANLLTMAITPQVEGVKPALDFEVTDVRALYATAPALVELTPKRREIAAMIKDLQSRNLPLSLPGVRIFETFKVSTR